MGLSGVVVSVLVLAGAACASLGDNSVEDRQVVPVHVVPVLAPPRDSKKHVTDRARQFPILVLLAQQGAPAPSREHDAKSLNNPQPIYVQVSYTILEYFVKRELIEQDWDCKNSTQLGTRTKTMHLQT